MCPARLMLSSTLCPGLSAANPSGCARAELTRGPRRQPRASQRAHELSVAGQHNHGTDQVIRVYRERIGMDRRYPCQSRQTVERQALQLAFLVAESNTRNSLL